MAIAARLLSSTDEVEHAVQETWLRLSRIDTEEIQNLDAWLAAHSIRIRVGGRPSVGAVINGRLVSIMAFTLAEASIARLDVLADPVKLQELRAASVVEMGGLS